MLPQSLSYQISITWNKRFDLKTSGEHYTVTQTLEEMHLARAVTPTEDEVREKITESAHGHLITLPVGYRLLMNGLTDNDANSLAFIEEIAIIYWDEWIRLIWSKAS